MNLRDLNSRYNTTERLVNIAIGTNTQLAGVNAARWSIAFCLSTGGGGTFKVSNQNQGLGMGTPIPNAGTPLVFVAKDFPGYVGGNFYAVSVTAGVSVTVIETVEVESSISGES